MIRVTMVPVDAALGSQETSRLEKQVVGVPSKQPQSNWVKIRTLRPSSQSLSLSGSTGQGWGPGIMDILPGPTDTPDASQEQASARSLALKGLRSRPG